MRSGLVLSIAAHLGLLAWGLFSLPGANALKPPVQPLPIDLVKVSEFEKLKKGTRNAKKITKSAGTKRKTKKKTTVSQAKARNKKRRRSTNKARPVSKKAAALAPSSKKKPVKTRKRKPVKTAKKTKPTKPSKTKKVVTKKARKTDNKKKKTTTRKTVRTASLSRKKKDFKPDAIRKLLNKTRKADGGDRKADGARSLGAKTSDREDVSMTQSEIAALYAQISRCWDPTNSIVGSDTLPVTVRFDLQKNGELAGRPVVTNSIAHPKFQAAADAARSAVQICAPFDLPARKYKSWRSVEFTFDPKDSLGG